MLDTGLFGTPVRALLACQTLLLGVLAQPIAGFAQDTLFVEAGGGSGEPLPGVVGDQDGVLRWRQATIDPSTMPMSNDLEGFDPQIPVILNLFDDVEVQVDWYGTDTQQTNWETEEGAAGVAEVTTWYGSVPWPKYPGINDGAVMILSDQEHWGGLFNINGLAYVIDPVIDEPGSVYILEVERKFDPTTECGVIADPQGGDPLALSTDLRTPAIASPQDSRSLEIPIVIDVGFYFNPNGPNWQYALIQAHRAVAAMNNATGALWSLLGFDPIRGYYRVPWVATVWGDFLGEIEDSPLTAQEQFACDAIEFEGDDCKNVTLFERFNDSTWMSNSRNVQNLDIQIFIPINAPSNGAARAYFGGQMDANRHHMAYTTMGPLRGGQTLAHELGHLHRMRHDAPNDLVGDANSYVLYNKGHTVSLSLSTVGTLMSYAPVRLSLFSNPYSCITIYFTTHCFGTVSDQYNFLVFQESDDMISGFR